jgi:small subunit ribosomal protein S9
MATEETIKKEPKAKAAHVPAAHAVKPAAAAHAPAHKPAAHAARAKAERYIEAIGRRKTAIARVRISNGTGKVSVNEKDSKHYFAMPQLAVIAVSPLEDLKIKENFDVSAHVSGGGIHAQAEAIRLGIARAIVEKNGDWKKRLRVSGYLTRDSRMVERKKYGLKKARRAPQWAKR